jgi:hypothetical protein
VEEEVEMEKEGGKKAKFLVLGVSSRIEDAVELGDVRVSKLVNLGS